MFIYGESGVGKSVSALQSSPLPILYIMSEPRDVTKFLIAADRKDCADQISFTFYTNWDEMMEFVNDYSNFKDYQTIIVDSISHLIAINLSIEIEDENFAVMDEKKKAEKGLTFQTKMSQEGYGTLAAQMLRFTNATSKLAMKGKTVIFLARQDQNPKFNRALSAGPTLKGLEYAKHFAGFCDFIGFVEPRVDDDNLNIYPPYVSFEPTGSYMAKWTGAYPPGGATRKVLNIEMILKAARGELNGKKKKEE
uniref:Putative ATPase domain containing protein n=1 Tax=viral metagenome TaxID=1070528 RepID=A0A6H1ZH16_9ZZZZ